MNAFRCAVCLTAWLSIATTALADVDQHKAPAEEDAVVNWVRAHAISLTEHIDSSDAALGDPSELEALDSILGKARIVALGEQMHGTHEPLALRNELFQHLVARLGFTAIAVESGLCESQAIYKFVLGTDGDAARVAREGFSWGFGGFGENVDLIRWMKNYNADPTHHRKVHFYGIDMCGGEDAEFTRSRVAIDAVLGYLQMVAPGEASRARAIVTPLLDRITSQSYRQIKPPERDALHALIVSWTRLFGTQRAVYIAASSDTAYEWAKRDVIAAAQIEAALKAWPLNNPPDGVSPDLYKVINIRDAAMAEDVRWVLKREGPSGRVLLFAHNAHIMNATSIGGIWRIYRQAPVAMGQHLRSALGKDLFIIASSSAQNEPGFPKMKLAAGGIDEVLARIGLPRYLVDLHQAGGVLVENWLDAPHPLSVGFVTEFIISPHRAYDAFVHFAELTHAHPPPASLTQPEASP
jgi:erythromycin esterase